MQNLPTSPLLWALIYPSSFQLSDVYGGREHVKDLSGWEGDTTFNANDMKPSIGEDRP